MQGHGPGAAFRFIAGDNLSGYSEGADRLVRAVRASGVRLEFRALEPGGNGKPAELRQHSRDPWPHEHAAPDAPTVANTIPPRLPQVREAVADGPLIWQTVWETDRLPKPWVPLLNDVDRVLVPTHWNRDVFVASGVTVPIAVVPYVVCDTVPGDGGFPLELPDDLVVFYTISQWGARKDLASTLRVFLEAFTIDDPVAFVIKTAALTSFQPSNDWIGDSPLVGTTLLEVARIVRSHPRPPLVRVEVGEWTPARIAGLHTRGDCFVSLTHGEGWHLGAFDASAYEIGRASCRERV